VLELEHCLPFLTLACLGLGVWGICWARSRSTQRVAMGRGVFLLNLLFLGATALVAAFHQAGGLLPLGLSAGGLIVGMLWESPAPGWDEPETEKPAE
jgi:hypothetical protein